MTISAVLCWRLWLLLILFDAQANACIFVAHDESILADILLACKFHPLLTTSDLLNLLLDSLSFVVKLYFVAIQKSYSLKHNASVSEERYLIACSKRLDSHRDCETFVKSVLDLDIFVSKVTERLQVKPDLIRQEEALNLDLQTYLVSILTTAFKCVEVFLLGFVDEVLCLLFFV